MGNSRKFTRDLNATTSELKAALKSAGIRSHTKRREAINRAASSRPSDLAQQARVSIALRRIAGIPVGKGESRG